MMKRIYISILVVICTCHASGQSVRVLNKRGDYFFDRYEYKKSVVYYTQAYNKDTSNYKSLLKLAASYSKLNNTVQAEKCYDLAFKTKDNIDNEYKLKYALILIANKKYNESKKWLELYNSSVEDDLRGKQYIKTLENVDELFVDSTIRIIENVRSVNTSESEINPVQMGEKLFFASTRTNSGGVVSNGYYDMFCAFHSQEAEFEDINFLNNRLNTSFHEGPMAVSSNGEYFFFTRNIVSGNGKQVKIGINKTSVPKSMDEVLEVEKIEIEKFNYSIGHPAVNHDGTVIYFISNAPGGVGGLDLYVTQLIDSIWSIPENLGKDINTKGDEMFPYLVNDSILYFASDGHGGLGGLDMFMVKPGDKRLQVHNLGYPINSPYDDFSISFFSENSGFFSSNRPHGEGSDDIYKFDLLQFKVKASLLDAENKSKLEDASISLLMANGEEYEVSSNTNGEFEFSITPGIGYKLIVRKENYEAAEILLNNEAGILRNKNMTIELDPIFETEIELQAGIKYNFVTGTGNRQEKFEENLLSLIANSLPPGTRGSSSVEILNKLMGFLENGVYSMLLVRDSSNNIQEGDITMLHFNDKTVDVNQDSIFINFPGKIEQDFRLQTDINYIYQNYNTELLSFQVDRSPLLIEDTTQIAGTDQDALNELEYLMSLSINTESGSNEDYSSIESIVAGGFSILPESAYTLKVSKKDSKGTITNTIEIPLNKGVKYDFGTDAEENDHYNEQLDQLLTERENVKIKERSAIDITVLSKELEIKEGEEFSFSIVPDRSSKDFEENGKELSTTIFLANKNFEIMSNEKFMINVPYTEDKVINFRTNIDHLQENYAASNIRLNVDTLSFFSEITIDTTGYYSRFNSAATTTTLTGVDQDALNELEYLMSLSINTERESNEDYSTIESIVAGGFSILPESAYTLKVSKKDSEGEITNTIEIPLAKGIKYDFGSDIQESLEYNKKLNQLLEGRETIDINERTAIDVQMLSKELEINEGEEINFSIIPETGSKYITPDTDELSSTIFLADKSFKLMSDEKFMINVPYTPERKVNIRTNIDYLQENYKADEIRLDVDTIPFFSEIAVDTTGYWERYGTPGHTTLSGEQDNAIDELNWLMGLSLNFGEREKIETKLIKSITAGGFSILPESAYTLKISKKDKEGQELTEKVEISLKSGVKYNFGNNKEQGKSHKEELIELFYEREQGEVDDKPAIDVIALSKELQLEEGETITITLEPDSKTYSGGEVGSTIVLSDRSFEIKSKEVFKIEVPYTEEGVINIQTDLNHLQENYGDNEIKLDIDTLAFFSEIAVDTTGYWERYGKPGHTTLTGKEDEAIDELKWLLGLSLNLDEQEKLETSLLKSITAEGFSIKPESDYTLKVSKTVKGTSQHKEIEIPLTSGVKYDFKNGSEQGEIHKEDLNNHLEKRDKVKIDIRSAIDVAMLSKQLDLEEGEKFTFRIEPVYINEDTGELSSTVYLAGRSFDIRSKEIFEIELPYTKEGIVNVQTNIPYLEKNYKAKDIKPVVDTVWFFSEIAVDTTGYWERYGTPGHTTLSGEQNDAIDELNWLMGLSLNLGEREKIETKLIKSITAGGFSILPESAYTLKVTKKSQNGEIQPEIVEIPLTSGVKYNFGDTPEQSNEHKQELKSLIQERENVEIDSVSAIEVAMLSKELELREGETITFSLQADSGVKEFEGLSSTIFLSDRSFDIMSNEEFRIELPYTQAGVVNVQTDISYLQSNYNVNEIKLDIDTVPFFSEITVDTTGYYSRFDNETGSNKLPDLTETNIQEQIITYRVQIAASRKPLSVKALNAIYSGNSEVRDFEEDGWIKYYIAAVPTYFEGKQILNDCGVKGAFVVAYSEGEKISLKSAMASQYKSRMEKSGSINNDSILNIVTVNFKFDEFVLRPDEEMYLNDLIIEQLKLNPKSYAIVNGHTDNQGTSVYNIGLANERATFVKNLMVVQGIEPGRIKTYSFGESQLLKACELPDDCDDSVHKVNRRVEIVLFLTGE